MKEALFTFIGLSLVVVFLYAIMSIYDFFHETPKQLKRIAEELHKSNSGYAQGYSMGYMDGKRYAEVKKKVTHETD